MSRPPLTRTILALLLSAMLVVPWAPAAVADREDRSGENAAEATNEQDGKSVFDLAFDVRNVSNGVVDQTNSAVAYANCENCQTVAIAIQIVLVTGMVDMATPTNVAVAVNEECVSCQTLALAYQFVLGGGESLRFTPKGRRELRRIQREFRRLGKPGLGVDEIAARSRSLADEIRNVLDTQRVPVRERNDERAGKRAPRDGDRDRDDDSGTDTAPEQPTETVPSEQPPAQPRQPPPEQQPPATTGTPPPPSTQPAPADGTTPSTAP